MYGGMTQSFVITGNHWQSSILPLSKQNRRRKEHYQYKGKWTSESKHNIWIWICL